MILGGEILASAPLAGGSGEASVIDYTAAAQLMDCLAEADSGDTEAEVLG